ncbi:MAG: hypothetical protein JWP01_3702 [Myxococcales bacterium]|nr:hypothetical protein [Myxococcales bacterium]
MHHRVRRAVIGTIAALFVPALAHAEAPGSGTATDGAIELEGEAAPTTHDVVAAPPALPHAPSVVPPVAEKFTWEPFGFLRLQYRIVLNDPNVAFIGRSDGFELQNARVGVLGALGDRVRYVFAIEGAVDERSHVNVPDGRLRVGLKDAFADVALGGSLTVRAGYFETLVDPDLDAENQRDFVDYAIESRGVRSTEGYQASGLTPGRSLGAALRLAPIVTDASGPKVGFEIAVQNGANEYASDNDNDTPAASASVFARLANQGWVVASARFNRRTVDELPQQKDEDDLQATLGAKIFAGPVGIGVGAAFVRTMFPTTGGPVENAYGAHAQLMIKTGTRLAVGYRFGILDPSSLFVTDRVMEHTAGVVLAVPAYRMRVHVQVTHVAEQGARALTNDRAQLAAELAL